MKNKIITSFCLALIINSFFTFIFSQTGIEEWILMSFISLIVSTLLILVVMCCVDDN